MGKNSKKKLKWTSLNFPKDSKEGDPPHPFLSIFSAPLEPARPSDCSDKHQIQSDAVENSNKTQTVSHTYPSLNIGTASAISSPSGTVSKHRGVQQIRTSSGELLNPAVYTGNPLQYAAHKQPIGPEVREKTVFCYTDAKGVTHFSSSQQEAASQPGAKSYKYVEELQHNGTVYYKYLNEEGTGLVLPSGIDSAGGPGETGYAAASLHFPPPEAPTLPNPELTPLTNKVYMPPPFLHPGQDGTVLSAFPPPLPEGGVVPYFHEGQLLAPPAHQAQYTGREGGPPPPQYLMLQSTQVEPAEMKPLHLPQQYPSTSQRPPLPSFLPPIQSLPSLPPTLHSLPPPPYNQSVLQYMYTEQAQGPPPSSDRLCESYQQTSLSSTHTSTVFTPNSLQTMHPAPMKVTVQPDCTVQPVQYVPLYFYYPVPVPFNPTHVQYPHGTQLANQSSFSAGQLEDKVTTSSSSSIISSNEQTSSIMSSNPQFSESGSDTGKTAPILKSQVSTSSCDSCVSFNAKLTKRKRRKQRRELEERKQELEEDSGYLNGTESSDSDVTQYVPLIVLDSIHESRQESSGPEEMDAGAEVVHLNASPLENVELTQTFPPVELCATKPSAVDNLNYSGDISFGDVELDNILLQQLFEKTDKNANLTKQLEENPPAQENIKLQSSLNESTRACKENTKEFLISLDSLCTVESVPSLNNCQNSVPKEEKLKMAEPIEKILHKTLVSKEKAFFEIIGHTQNIGENIEEKNNNQGNDTKIEAKDLNLIGSARNEDTLETSFKKAGDKFEKAGDRFEKVKDKFEEAGYKFEKVKDKFEKAGNKFEKDENRFERAGEKFEKAGDRFEKAEDKFEIDDDKFANLDLIENVGTWVSVQRRRGRPTSTAAKNKLKGENCEEKKKKLKKSKKKKNKNTGCKVAAGTEAALETVEVFEADSTEIQPVDSTIDEDEAIVEASQEGPEMTDGTNGGAKATTRDGGPITAARAGRAKEDFSAFKENYLTEKEVIIIEAQDEKAKSKKERKEKRKKENKVPENVVIVDTSVDLSAASDWPDRREGRSAGRKEKGLTEPVILSTQESPIVYYPLGTSFMTCMNLGTNVMNHQLIPVYPGPSIEETYVKSRLRLRDLQSIRRGLERNVILIRDQKSKPKDASHKRGSKQPRQMDVVPGPRVQYNSRGFGGVLGMRKVTVAPASLVNRLSIF